jgi:hypothetical protein
MVTCRSLRSTGRARDAQDSSVAIVDGRRDLRVVVRKMDGTMVADGITLGQLRARSRALRRRDVGLRSAEGSYVDATLDLAHID